MRIVDKIRLQIEPVEQLILKVVAGVLCINAILIFWHNPSIDWASYGMLLLVAVACFIGGQIYRISGRSPRLGLALICTGIFPLFSWSIVMFNYLLLPVRNAPIDDKLIWFDGLYGYHWPDFVAWAAQHPVLSGVLKGAYASSILQMGILIIVLGMTGRAKQLHIMMVSLMFTSLLAVCFWWLFPTFGPSAVYAHTAELKAVASSAVDTSYGEQLVNLASTGPGYISPSNVEGLIGFPSYHTVLAFTAAYFMRDFRILFPIFVVLNILVLVATPLHGGHHLADLLGGFVLFVVGIVFANHMVTKMYKTEGRSAQLSRELGQAATA